MKNWMIATLVVLMGLILTLQWLNKKNEVKLIGMPASQPAPMVETPAKSSLPAGYMAAMPTRQPLAQVPEPDGSKGSCAGGTLNDILAAHGYTWGYLSGVVFEQRENEDLTVALERYFACQVVSLESPGACGNLSSNEAPWRVRNSPRPATEGCLEHADPVLFAAFMAGKHSDPSSCERSLRRVKSFPLESLDKICQKFSQGQENFCARGNGEMDKKCRGAYPAKESDCAGSKKSLCLDRYLLYTAMKAGDSSICPSEYRASCEAFLSKKPSNCSGLAMKASSLYCSSLKNLKKKEDDKNNEVIRQEAEKQRQELKKQQQETEKRDRELNIERKAEEKTLQETNKNLRKLMGRE